MIINWQNKIPTVIEEKMPMYKVQNWNSLEVISDLYDASGIIFESLFNYFKFQISNQILNSDKAGEISKG